MVKVDDDRRGCGRCATCGEYIARGATGCQICLAPHRVARVSLLPRRPTLVSCLLLPLLFVATCTMLLPVGATVMDPMTHGPLTARFDMPFPVIVMSGDVPHVHLLRDLHHIPPLPRGSSYL